MASRETILHLIYTVNRVIPLWMCGQPLDILLHRRLLVALLSRLSLVSSWYTAHCGVLLFCTSEASHKLKILGIARLSPIC
jgi:hypothetical protein